MPVDLKPIIWTHWVPLKIKGFIWRARLYRIPCNTSLKARGVDIGLEECLMCFGLEETADHVLLTCPFADSVWSRIQQGMYGIWSMAGMLTAGGYNEADPLSNIQGNDHADLHNQLWHECAGLTMKVPQIGDRVFYFPQGHLEQIKECMKDGDVPNIPNYHLPSKVLCKVVDVVLKADPDSEEVFAEIVLLPNNEEGEGLTFRSVPQKIPASSFRKILSISDASTHGGCGLPKAHVEKTFPPLDQSQDQASQDLIAKDLHGQTWKFRHIYRGDPKRHMLVNGWNKFVSEKKLKAGDTCIFIRGSGQKEIYIGIQRAIRILKESTDLTGPAMRHGVLVNASVAMDTRCEFTVIYHPKMCASAFIVPYDKVMEALRVNYLPEMGVEMLVTVREDLEYTSKSFSGIITAVEDVNPAKWLNSEWRCLKVQWDVTSSNQVLPPRVSPWEIQPLEPLVVPLAKGGEIWLNTTEGVEAGNCSWKDLSA
ncbi:hypothetical protein QVD17_31278 [Tagetes erecta]|uniref:Auxin response factor n=1 Tax=Tagetes erecta TaxID=13708 RepID=A0AAD8K6R0_TARER|nr:hypothetical protein QVD17_31278 [Tagetes erecta]